MNRGNYIVIDGCEGMGKTTQAKILSEKMGALLVREPGGTETGERIRNILLSNDCPRQNPLTDVLLHAAQRAELAAAVIEPVLRSGKNVVSDRSWASSYAYQGAQGVSKETILSINQHALGSYLLADRVVVLDGDVNTGLARKGASLDYYESMARPFHEAVRTNFDEVVDVINERGGMAISVHAVDTDDITFVERNIWANVRDLA